jgi:hypothetical protein
MSTIHDRFGSKFASVESNSWSENYFSTVIQNFAEAIFPFHHCFPFEVDMYYLGDKVRPDLILIEKNYRDWWLVEVELERHSWLSHIQAQIDKILNADITETHIKKLDKFSGILDLGRLNKLMSTVNHKTLVIVDSEPKAWMEDLQSTDARLMTVQVYRNATNDHIIRCDTDLPQTGSPIISYLKPSKEGLFPGWLEIESPHRLSSSSGKAVIECENQFFECSFKDFGGKTYLIPPSRFKFVPLNPSNRLVLLEEDLVSPDQYFKYTLRGKVVEYE